MILLKLYGKQYQCEYNKNICAVQVHYNITHYCNTYYVYKLCTSCNKHCIIRGNSFTCESAYLWIRVTRTGAIRGLTVLNWPNILPAE